MKGNLLTILMIGKSKDSFKFIVSSALNDKTKGF